MLVQNRDSESGTPHAAPLGVSLVLLVLAFARLAGTTHAEDCNGNGTDDAMDVQSGASTDCNVDGVPDECEGPFVAFDDSTRLENSAVGHGVIVADFNGDGAADLAVGLSLGLSVRLSSAGRELFEWEEAEYPAASTRTRPWEGGDVDGDGDIDIVTVESGGLSLYLNDGAGVFADPVLVPLTPIADRLRVRDLTGDDLPELVVLHRSVDQMAVLTNLGGVAFSAPVVFPVGQGPQAVEVADLDGQAGPDIVVLNAASDDLSLFLSNGQAGFTSVIVTPGGNLEKSLVAEDLNGDGLADLALAADAGAVVLLNEGPNEGAVRFSAPSRLASDLRTVIALAAGDVDGDGDGDLVAHFFAPASEILFFVNQGDGRFNRATSLHITVPATSILLADIDGDGAEDVAMVGSGAKRTIVLWNVEDEAKLPLPPSVTYDAMGEPHTTALGDLDGDNDIDIVTGNNNDRTMSVLFNQGDGTFTARLDRVSFPGFSLVVGDWNLDGTLDVAVADNIERVLILSNDGMGTFQFPFPYRVGRNPFHITAGDVDGDGDGDLVATNRGSASVTVLKNAGDGTFEERAEYGAGSDPRASVLADLDGDGLLDIAVASQGKGVVSLLRNAGGGKFATEPEVALVDRPNFIVAGDFDLDGAMDLATGSEDAASMILLWNDGLGGLQTVTRMFAGNAPYSLSVNDLNEDGRLDLVSVAELPDSGSRDSTVTVLLNIGERGFRAPLRVPVGRGPRYVVTGDLDNDGDVDIVSANRLSSDLTVFLSGVSDLRGFTHLESVCTAQEYFDVSLPTRPGSAKRRVGKYVVPAREDPDLLPTVFQNAGLFESHDEFLATVFPEKFSFLLEDPELYDSVVGRRSTRDYFVGSLDLRRQDGLPLYTFSTFADTGFDFREVLTQEEIGIVFARLSAAFALRPLAYAPDTQAARKAVASWDNAEFPIFLEDTAPAVQYEAYTLAAGYGRVRLLTLEEFDDRNRDGGFTFQDIVVVDQAPQDIEGVVGGVITGAVQGDLSPVAIRTARRGTPNAFVADARHKLAEFEGSLVRLEVFPGEFFVSVVEPAEAEAFWASSRRSLSRPPVVDREYRELDTLSELDLNALDGRPEGRYGGKAANFARLQQILTGDSAVFREPGFAVPMIYYLDFLQSNVAEVDGRVLTYEQWLFELLSSPAFESDSQTRFAALDAFRVFVREHGVVDPDLVARLATRIGEVFGDQPTMVRFRSSSNVEDALEFNGAGLYESTSVCARDTLDSDERDASFCDASRDNERTIERALRKVWTSLWTFRAHEERTFYQIAPDAVTMGILVTRAFLDEAANGVAFTGNPRDPGDKRYVVAAQLGEASVVSPESGTAVERDVLEVVDGEVVSIHRSRASSLVAPGEVVMTDEKLHELGALLWEVEQRLPVDLEGRDPADMILEFEFKVEASEELAVKQVRPFLIPGAELETPSFALDVPSGAVVCGVFSPARVGREPREEYETKGQVALVPGLHRLPTAEMSFEGELIAEVRFGSEESIARPLSPGSFSVVAIPTDGTRTTYRFTYAQEFRLPGGEILELRIFRLDFLGRGRLALDEARVLDDRFLTFGLEMEGVLDGAPVAGFSSCSSAELQRWELQVDFGVEDGGVEDGGVEDGGVEGGGIAGSIALVERFLPTENLAETGPASLVYADITLGTERQTTGDYWRLVYSARRHNLDPRYWVILEPPVIVEGLPAAVRVVEVATPEPAIGPDVDISQTRLRLLDEDFALLAEPTVFVFSKGATEAPPDGVFLRGDVDSDGERNLSDALLFLNYVFARGSQPPCLSSGDVNDDGRLRLDDVIGLLRHLVGQTGPLPPPFEDCAGDPTPDGLSCGRFPICS